MLTTDGNDAVCLIKFLLWFLPLKRGIWWMLEWDKNIPLSFSDSVPDRLVSDKVDSVLIQDKPAQETVPSEKRGMEEKRSIVKNPQHVIDTSIDDIGIPLRVRQWQAYGQCTKPWPDSTYLRTQEIHKSCRDCRDLREDRILIAMYFMVNISVYYQWAILTATWRKTIEKLMLLFIMC